MTNFIVGLTNTTPGVLTTLLGSYSICAQYPGFPAGGSRVIMECQSNTLPGRYLILQLPIVNYLSACEIEVFTVPPSQLGNTDAFILIMYASHTIITRPDNHTQ